MASLRQIRGRIRSIHNSGQIMRAMQMVSGSKLRRAQDKFLRLREVMEFLDGLLGRVLASQRARQGRGRGQPPALSHPLCARRQDGEATLVIITSDAGLCGSYNTQLIHLADSTLRQEGPRPAAVIFIGKRAHRHLTKRGFQAAETYLDLAGRPDLAKAQEIGRSLLDRFLSGRASSISILYARYVSPMVYRPTVEPFLPITFSAQPAQPAKSAQPADYIFEPSAQRIFEALLPRWALMKFSLILMESFTSEHSARMFAMQKATDNAQELLGSLTQLRNRIRQAAITKELSEIVGTAEALK
ncbi:MAG: ATP synthase F1 subunit gamma [Candidatus Omnitrophica bacterium]|nr:ATP synthase F1 subunit gamma [Candidatus Omnitrophota bacterium]